jgi:PKD repeat protein
MAKRIFSALSILAALLAAGACTVHQTTAPSLTGPSEFALSVGVTASPDSISQDGGSQSSIHVSARDASGNPVARQAFRLDIEVNGAETDYGTLSGRTLVTGSDGVAVAIYTAPPPPPNGSTVAHCTTFSSVGALAGQCVRIVATPTGSDFAGSQTQSVEIRLMPVGIILPPGDLPVASFVVTPTPASLNVPVFFDASASCATPLSGGACNPSSGLSPTITQYSWSFGDGATASGRTASHTYTTTGTFTATLTVTNSSGLAAFASQGVTIGASALPSGDWVFSPAAPAVGDTVVFNGDGVQPIPGRTLVQFSWNFGDGATASGFLTTHAFTTAGAYNVVFSVLDDAGQKKVISKTVTVGTGSPTASFTFAATGGHAITADGSASVAAGSATIATYFWSWGDGGSTAASAAAVANHAYAAGLAGTTVTVTLTVTDSLGRAGSTSQTVTVP